MLRFPEEDRRIYVHPDGRKDDPLYLRQQLVEASGGLVWALLGRRRELWVKLRDKGLDTGAEASAELELARIERQLIQIIRRAHDLAELNPIDGGGFTADETLNALDHFIHWLNQKKVSTAA